MGTYKLFARRWLVLAIGFIINFALWSVAHPFIVPSTAGIWLCASDPIPVIQTRFVSYAWFIASIVGSLPGLWLMKHVGLRKALTISVSFMVLGVSLRCVVFAAQGMAREPETGISTCSKSAYWWILGGNCLAALGAVPIQASVATLAATWFPASQFGMAATLMSLSIPAGLHSNLLIIHLSERSKMLLAIDFDRELIVHVAIAALALLAVPLLGAAPPSKPCITAEPPHQSERDLEDVASATSSQNGVSTAQELLAPLSPLGDNTREQGGFCVPTSDAAGLGVAAVVSSSPQGTIPQQLKRERERLEGPLLAEVRTVLLFPNFWKILIAFSAGMGSCMVYYLLLEEFLDSVDGANLEDAINLPVVAGSFAAIAVPASVLSCLLDCTRGHKWIIAASQTVVAALAAVLTIGISSTGAFENIQACLICMSVMAFLAIPIALDITTERTFPIRPALPTALLWVGMYATAAVLGILTDTALVNDKSPRPRFSGAKYMLLGCFAVATVLWWVIPVRYVRRAVEDTYKEGLARSNASHSRLLSGGSSRGSEPRSGRLWISGASGRITVPSINRNLYIIAEEHGTSSSGGHTGGGTGSIRNLHSATGTDADRLPTSADSLRDQVPQLPQLQQAYAGLLGPQAGAVTHSGVGDSNSGKMKQQAAESSWSGGRVTSQMELSEQGSAGSDVSIKLPMSDSQYSEQLRDRIQRPITGDLRSPRQPPSATSLSQSTSNSTSNARESQRTSSRSSGSRHVASNSHMGSDHAIGGVKGTTESVASASSLRFAWRLPPFSYFLNRGSGAINSGSLTSSRGARPPSSTPAGSGSVSGGDTTISRSSSQSIFAPRVGSGSRGTPTAELAGKSDASLIRWVRDSQNGGDSVTGESSIVSGGTEGAGGSVASSMTLAHQLRKPSGSLASGTVRAATRIPSGSMPNESFGEAGMGYHQQPRVQSDQRPSDLHNASTLSSKDGGRPHTAPSLRDVVRERNAANVRQIQALAHGQVHANSMMGHVSDSGVISEDLYSDQYHSGRTLQPQHPPQHASQLQSSSQPFQSSSRQAIASSGSAHMHDGTTSVALSSRTTSAAASVSFEGTATVALREKVDAVQSTALQSLGRPVHVSSVAAAAEAAAAAQQIELQPTQNHGQQLNTDDVGDTIVGAGTLTEILQPGDMGDAERFADPFSPRGSQSKTPENLSNLSMSTARTTVVAATSGSPASTEETAAAAADAAGTPLPPGSVSATGSSPQQGTAGSASAMGTSTSPAGVPGSSHLVSTMSSLGQHDSSIPYGTPARGSMVWWANPLGDRQSPDGTPIPAATLSTAGTDQMSSFTAQNDQSIGAGHGDGTWTQDNSTIGAPYPYMALQGKRGCQLSDDIAAAVIDLDHSARLQPCDAQEDPMADSGMLELNPQLHRSSVPAAGPSSATRRHPLSPVKSSPTQSHSQGQSPRVRSGSFRAPSSRKADGSSRHLGDPHDHDRDNSHSVPLDRDDSSPYTHDDETPFHSPRTPGHRFNSRSPSASPRSHNFMEAASPVNAPSDDGSTGSGGQADHEAQGAHGDGGDTICNTISFSPSPHDPHIAGRTVMHSIDGLLHSSLQSSQLFGSVLTPQNGLQQSSQLDPVSAIAVRMQHHDATSSVLQPFTHVESALLQPHAGLHPGQQLLPVRVFPGVTPSRDDPDDSFTKSQGSISSPTAEGDTSTSQRHQVNTQSAYSMSPPVLSLGQHWGQQPPTQVTDPSSGSATDPTSQPQAPQRSQDTAAESSTYDLSSVESFTRVKRHHQAQHQRPEEAQMGTFEGFECETTLESNYSAPRSSKSHPQKVGVPLDAVLTPEKRETAATRAGLSKFFGPQAKKWLPQKQKGKKGNKTGSLFDSPLTSPEIPAPGNISDTSVQQKHKSKKGNASQDASMCLDTYPEAPSGRLVRDRSMFSVAASIDIQFHHHVAPTDELSQKSASLMADESLLLEPIPDHSTAGGTDTYASPHRSSNNSELEGQDFTISPVVHPTRTTTSQPPSRSTTPPESSSSGAPSSQNTSKTSKGSRRSKRGKDSKLKAPERPSSAPIAVSAAKAAAARFGVAKQTALQAAAKWRTIESLPAPDLCTDARTRAPSRSTAAVLRTPPGKAAPAAAAPVQVTTGIAQEHSEDRSERKYTPNVISHGTQEQPALPSSSNKSHSSASASRRSSESLYRPQSAPVKAAGSRGGAAMDGSGGSLKGPSGGLLRDVNSAVAGGSSRASSTVSGAGPDAGDADAEAALRALLEGGDDEPTGLSTASGTGILNTASGVLHTMSGGVRPPETSLPYSIPALLNDPNTLHAQGEADANQAQMQHRDASPHNHSYGYNQNRSYIPTTPADVPAAQAPAQSQVNQGGAGAVALALPQQLPPPPPQHQLRLRPQSPSDTEPPVDTSAMDSNPREMQGLESITSGAIDTDAGRDHTSAEFSAQASATYTLSVMSHELHSQGLRGTVSTADGSGTIRRPLSGVSAMSSGVSAMRSESPSRVPTAVRGEHARGEHAHPRAVLANASEVADARDGYGSAYGGYSPGGDAGGVHGRQGIERSRNSSRDMSPNSGAPSLRERFALHQQQAKQQKQVVRQHAVQGSMTMPVRATSSNSSLAGGAATGRRSPHAAAALAVAQAQVRYRMGVQNGQPGQLQQPLTAPMSIMQAANPDTMLHAPHAPQQHVLPHQSINQDERSRRFWQQSQDALAAAAQGRRLSVGAQLPALQLEAATLSGPGSFREMLSAGLPGPLSRDRDMGNSNSRLYSLPGAGDSASANESPSCDAIESGGSCITDRSLESNGKPFGSEFGWSSVAPSSRGRQGPGSATSQGKPHPLAHVQQKNR